MDRPREFVPPNADSQRKPDPPPPPPMREVRGPFGAETKASKERTAEWQRRHYERTGTTPPTTGDPAPTKRTTAQWFKLFHLYATIFWVAMVYPTIVYWHSSVSYLVFISVYAIIVSHLEAWQTARMERQQEKKEEG